MSRVFSVLLALVFLSTLFSSCGVNIFSPFSAKYYPEANEYEGAKLLNQGKYEEILKNPDRYTSRDYLAAALGSVGIDHYIITNLVNQQSNQSILGFWLNAKDKDYLGHVVKASSRAFLEVESKYDTNLAVVLTLGGVVEVMLSILYLSEIAANNGASINTSDGIDSSEFDVLSTWLGTGSNITNLFYKVNVNGTDVSLVSLIVTGVTHSSVGIAYFGGESFFTTIKSQLNQFDSDNNGIIDETDVTNYIVNFLTNNF